MSPNKISYVLIDKDKNIIFKKSSSIINTKYTILWIDQSNAAKNLNNKTIDEKFQKKNFLNKTQKKLLLRLFKKILFLIDNGHCDKIVLLISHSAIDVFRILVPKNITKIIALQIKEEHSALSLKEIDEKILRNFT